MSLWRQERLSSLYQETISLFFEKNFRPKGAIFSITKVEVGEGLKRLKIYFSIWPDEKVGDTMKFLVSLKRELRAYLADRVKTKFAPTLEFVLDESLKNQSKIEGLLKKLK
jgi:ribosome-binding factor A